MAAENNAKKCLRALIKAGALLDTQNLYGYTALHVAAAEGHVQCTKELLIAGAQMDLVTHDRNDGFNGGAYTPMDVALKEGHQNVVLLLRRWDPSWSRRHASSPSDCIQTWSVTQVGVFLRRLSMAQYVPVFSEHNIDGLALAEMTEARLEKELQITRPMHRIRILENVLMAQMEHMHLVTCHKRTDMDAPDVDDDDENRGNDHKVAIKHKVDDDDDHDGGRGGRGGGTIQKE